jgi:hypothetical protein
MPTVLRVDGFEFVIHTNDHAPANVHVFNADGECRITLDPEPALDRVWSMKQKDARRAERIAAQHAAELRAA